MSYPISVKLDSFWTRDVNISYIQWNSVFVLNWSCFHLISTWELCQRMLRESNLYITVVLAKSYANNTNNIYQQNSKHVLVWQKREKNPLSRSSNTWNDHYEPFSKEICSSNFFGLSAQARHLAGYIFWSVKQKYAIFMNSQYVLWCSHH